MLYGVKHPNVVMNLRTMKDIHSKRFRPLIPFVSKVYIWEIVIACHFMNCRSGKIRKHGVGSDRILIRFLQNPAHKSFGADKSLGFIFLRQRTIYFRMYYRVSTLKIPNFQGMRKVSRSHK